MESISGTIGGIGMLLGVLIFGIGGPIWYLKDKTIITTGPGATFELYLKYAVPFGFVGGLLGFIIGYLFGSVIVIALTYWYIVAIIAGVIAYNITGDNVNKALVAGAIVAVIGFGANSYIQSNVQPVKATSSNANNTQNKNNTETKNSSNTNSVSKSQNNLFDGSAYGLDDLTPEEQAQANSIVKDTGSDFKAHNYIMMARCNNGGMPKDSNKEHGITDKKISSGASLQSGDLMLGNVAVGESFDLVSTKKMGYPAQIKENSHKNNDVQCLYASYELNYRDDTITSITTSNKNIKTPRGIHPGSSLNDIINAYGKEYKALGKEELTDIGKAFKKESTNDLYNDFTKNKLDSLSGSFAKDYDVLSYKIDTKNGTPCLLCFIVKKENKAVDYISIFYADKNYSPIAFNS